ncbi:MAG: hypothetical protein HOP29_03045 [Phycisphaerales bacterium]|nr:hypothetical protein [Phycisphaerales bacterium]
MSEAEVKPCEGCGASVYPEHVISEKAGLIDGRLLCTHCMTEYKQKHHTDERRLPGQPSMRAPGEGAGLESLAVIDDESMAGSGNIRAISADTLAGAALHVDDSEYRRPLNPNAPAATRCRTFHAKLNDGAVAFMNRQVNDWADHNPDVTIKYAASTIGVWEGKKADPHMILTIFY